MENHPLVLCEKKDMGDLMGEIFYSVQGKKNFFWDYFTLYRSYWVKIWSGNNSTEWSRGSLEKVILIEEKSHSTWTNGHSKAVRCAGEEDPDVPPTCTSLACCRGVLSATRNSLQNPQVAGARRAGRPPSSGAPMRDSTDGHHQGEKQWVMVNHNSVFWGSLPWSYTSPPCIPSRAVRTGVGLPQYLCSSVPQAA